MKLAITVDTVRESYTLVNKSAVVLGSQELKSRIEKIKDSFKKCA